MNETSFPGSLALWARNFISVSSGRHRDGIKKGAVCSFGSLLAGSTHHEIVPAAETKFSPLSDPIPSENALDIPQGL
jgi:hypothetical protein